MSSYPSTLDEATARFDHAVNSYRAKLKTKEIGTVQEVERGVARVRGLPHVEVDEVLQFTGGRLGYAFNLDPDEVGCVLLDSGEEIGAGTRLHRLQRVLDTAVGDELLGRVVDPVGRVLDGGHRLDGLRREPCQRDAPPIMQRAPVTVPLQTGWKVIDAMIPIGRGQRQLLLGDRQTGKTSIAVDTIINQRRHDVVCVYCCIGQPSTGVARVIENLRRHGAMDHTIVVVGADDAPPGIPFLAPYAATTMGEHFMRQGRDVLIIYDDLTAHARAYRHLSLLLRRPPGREAFPGDIFYVHSRLLERATHLRDGAGGGSLTALPIITTEAQNVSAYIPTNLISITDGQIYLSPTLFRKGVLPAIDVGRSVSRVGGKTQLPAYRVVAGDLRLTYSQFEELERFARFSSQLDADTQATLNRGRLIREILKQPQFQPLTLPRQIASLIAVTQGKMDTVSLDQVSKLEREIGDAVTSQAADLCERMQSGEPLDDAQVQQLAAIAAEVVDANA